MEAHEEYFIRPPAKQLRAFGARPQEVALAHGSARPMQALTAILVGLGGLLAGFAVPVAVAILSIMSFDTPSENEMRVAIAIGVAVAICGIAAGIASWIPWRKAPAFMLDDDELVIRYPGFRKPFVVPRALVRVVSMDETPVVYFQRNDRFPVHSDVPSGVFVDALDMHPASPWEPDAPEARRLFPFPSAPTTPSSKHLWTADGSALPFLRVNPGDVPNVAVVFDESVRTPRAPIAVALFCRTPIFLGGKRVRGVLLRAGNAGRARAVFGTWDIVRPITAADVVEEKLLLPKPLRGARTLIYAGLLIAPAVLNLIARRS